MLWGMEDLRWDFFGMQDMNSKKQAGKVVCGIGHPPCLTPYEERFTQFTENVDESASNENVAKNNASIENVV